MIPKVNEIATNVNEYFFGGTPSPTDAVWFYGFIGFCLTIVLLIGTLTVLY
jgi:hypothetical protein